MSFSRRIKKWDILCAGELLATFHCENSNEKAVFYQKYELLPGGDLANLCMNMARLGNHSRLVASVGLDEMGTLLYRKAERLGIDLGSLRMVESPSTLHLEMPSKDQSSSQFYRNADFMLSEDQMSNDVLANVTLFHTTCFALSKEPARSLILNAAGLAYDLGSQLSLDLNYDSKIWPDRQEAQSIIAEYCQLRPLVKVRAKDWEIYSGKGFDSPKSVVRHFLNLGASSVAVLMEDETYLVADQEEDFRISGHLDETIGAKDSGQAFWSGFLTAWLDGGDLKKCAQSGQRIAELITTSSGPLPDRINREEAITG